VEFIRDSASALIHIPERAVVDVGNGIKIDLGKAPVVLAPGALRTLKNAASVLRNLERIK
jgi:hypothetical protein